MEGAQLCHWERFDAFLYGMRAALQLHVRAGGRRRVETKLPAAAPFDDVNIS